eukprot:m.88896 g.88896  ORF g.88896 m.88896 type:complete len:196 (+) comp13195_c0_seq3:206-793(+)
MDTTNLDVERYKVGETYFDSSIPKLALLKINDDTPDEHCATFVIGNEDHTLGNSLKYCIMKDPEVEFCGYTLPHPSERKIHLRIQTTGSKTCVEALQDGLTNLANMNSAVADEFDKYQDIFKGFHLFGCVLPGLWQHSKSNIMWNEVAMYTTNFNKFQRTKVLFSESNIKVAAGNASRRLVLHQGLAIFVFHIIG